MRETENEPKIHEEAVVLSPMEFLVDFKDSIKQARERVLVQAMTFEADHVNLLIANALLEASARGVPVFIKVDGFVRIMTADTPNYLINLVKKDGGWSKHLRSENERMLESFVSAGIDFEMTNEPKLVDKLLMARGRNHRKIFLVDDVLYMGGLNLSQKVFEREDFVIKITDKDIVEMAASVYKNTKQSKSSTTLPCGSDTEYLIEGGGMNSLIIAKAVILIDRARRRVEFMTSLAPTGEIRRALLRAVDRGVTVRTFSSWAQCRTPFESYTPNRGSAHAKLLVADQWAIFGSHNFDWRLAVLKTEEMSIMTSRTHIVDPLRKYFEKTISET